MDSTPALQIVIATYNEIQSLPSLIAKLHSRMPQASILVIDDNSPDGTGTWCDEHRHEYPFLDIVHRSGKQGLGSATIHGLARSIERHFEFVATLDADLSHDPDSLVDMLKTICSTEHRETGVMIGSRYVPGGEIHGWPWYRRISSAIVNMYANIALGLRTKDNTSAFRIYRTAALRKIDLNRVNSPGYAYLEEILLHLRRANVKAAELPIVFINRETGKSKVDLRELASSLFQILKLSLKSSTSR